MDLARVIVFTGNVLGLVEFYASTFGLKVVGEIDQEWMELDAGGCKIAFHKAGAHTTGKSDSGIKLVFGSNDVSAERERLESLGIKMSKIMEFGSIQMCDGYDPDGRRFQISSRGI